MENNNKIESNSNSNNNITCKSCNTDNNINSKFCKKCGAKLSNKKPIIIGIIAIALYFIGVFNIIIDNTDGVIAVPISIVKTPTVVESNIYNMSLLSSLFILSGIVMAIYGAIRYPKNHFFIIFLILMIVSIISYFIISLIIACIKKAFDVILDCLTCGGLG